jgi:holo-[acyl-carrier protein] synthase
MTVANLRALSYLAAHYETTLPRRRCPAMIVSVGLDIVEIARIEKDLQKFGERFVERILGEGEQAVYGQRRDRSLFLAGRFAAKEAVVKALGVYLSDRPPLSQLEIVSDTTGRPQLILPDEIAAQLHGARCFLSITHERKYAAAVAIFEEDR